MTADRNPTPRELAADPVREAAKLFRAQIDRALRFLGSTDPADIHRARKQLKSARATLRLLRPAIGDGRYRRENVAARAAARKLSHARDSIVLLDTLDDLAQRAGDDMPSGTVEALQAALRRRQGAIAGRQLRSGQLEAKRTLKDVATRAMRWILPVAQGTLLLQCARSTYRRRRQAVRDARVAPTVENLHDWRKQVKYGWHQLQFFTPLAHGHLGALADDFHQLSDYLGDDHDLAMLQDFILEQHG